MQEQQTNRFHGEVRIQRNGVELRVNIFGDNRSFVYQEIQYAIAQFSGDPKYMNQAQLEVARAEQAKAAAKAAAPFKEPAKSQTVIVRSGATKQSHKLICQGCGTDEAMELIRWNDKTTGEPRQAWKCQNCNLWWKEW